MMETRRHRRRITKRLHCTTRSSILRRGCNHFDVIGGVDNSFMAAGSSHAIRERAVHAARYASRCRSHDPHNAKRVGEASKPGPADRTFAIATLIKTLDSLLNNVERAPSGLRLSAYEITNKCINAAKDGRISTHEQYTALAGGLWEEHLTNQYDGYVQLHEVDRRRCTDSFVRHDWHSANARIIRLMCNGGVRPHGAEDCSEDYLVAAPVLAGCTEEVLEAVTVDSTAQTGTQSMDTAPDDELDSFIYEANQYYEQAARDCDIFE